MWILIADQLQCFLNVLLLTKKIKIMLAYYVTEIFESENFLRTGSEGRPIPAQPSIFCESSIELAFIALSTYNEIGI